MHFVYEYVCVGVHACVCVCVCVHAWDPENVYTSVESNDVHGDKPHLILEWSLILVSLL